MIAGFLINFGFLPFLLAIRLHLLCPGLERTGDSFSSTFSRSLPTRRQYETLHLRGFGKSSQTVLYTPAPCSTHSESQVNMLMSSTSVVALLAVAGITLAVLKFLKYFRKWRLLKKIPKPDLVPYHWFLGRIPTFSKLDEKNLWYAIREVEASLQKNSAFTSIVSIFHSKHIAAIHKEPKTNVVYNLIKPWLGEGLLNAQGEKWKKSQTFDS